MEMMAWRKVVLLFFLLVVVPLAVYGVHVQYRNATETIPEIMNDLVGPYAQTIKDGDYSVAYERYTSSGFKAVHSLDAYLKAQQDNRVELGPLEDLSLKRNDPFQSAGNLFSGRRYHEGGLVWRGKKKETWVWWEVVRENGVFKVDATFEMFHERLDPRIF